MVVERTFIDAAAVRTLNLKNENGEIFWSCFQIEIPPAILYLRLFWRKRVFLVKRLSLRRTAVGVVVPFVIGGAYEGKGFLFMRGEGVSI